MEKRSLIFIIVLQLIVISIVLICSSHEKEQITKIFKNTNDRYLEYYVMVLAYGKIVKQPSLIEFYSNTFRSAQDQYRINWKVFAAITKVESGYNPAAVSHKGARGLMQLIPPTAERVAGLVGDKYSDGDEFRDTLNLKWGCHYLGKCKHDFGAKKYIGAYLSGSSKTNGDTQTYDSLVNVEIKRLDSLENKLTVGE